jgi:hypothetical protein
MCFLANFLEVIMHTLKRLVSARGHEGTRSHEDFFELLWSRATSELMVLGFLAFIVWCTARTGGFDAIAAMLPNPYEGCDPYIIAKYSPADLVHLRSKGRRLAAAESTCDGTYTKSEAYCIALGKARKHGRALLHFPTTGPDLLHVVEDVHMEVCHTRQTRRTCTRAHAPAEQPASQGSQCGGCTCGCAAAAATPDRICPRARCARAADLCGDGHLLFNDGSARAVHAPKGARCAPVTARLAAPRRTARTERS